MTEDQDSGGATLAAVELVDIERLPELRDANTAATALQQQASRLQVHDTISAETATALLGQVVAARRHAEAQRLELTRPLNAVLGKINAAAKRTTEPLKTVELDLKAKLTAYQREQERLAAEEHARQAIEAERRRQEEARQRRAAEESARVEREAAARALAQAEATAKRARLEGDIKRADALAGEMSTLTDEQLDDIAGGADDDARAVAASRETDRRVRLRQVNREARAARDRAAAAGEAEQQARDAPALPITSPRPVAPTRLAGGGAKVSVRKRWDYEVIDFAKVPDAYKVIDLAAVRSEIRRGARTVPGLRIFQVDDASVRL